MNSILDVNNISIMYEKMSRPIIDNVSFSIDKGSVLGIVGESGCGKTTLAKALMGVLPKCGKVTGGEARFEDIKNILSLSKKELKNIQGNGIGIITQESLSSLNPVKKIGCQFLQILYEKLNVKKNEAYETAHYFLRRMNCPDDIMKKYPFQLSGGQRQRVIIAMAFALRPKLLIADEPTTALDVTVQAQVLKEIMELKENFDTGILIISHNLGVIAQVCDNIAVMYNGKIVEIGHAKTILNSPSHPYTKGLINSIPDLYYDRSKKLYNIPEYYKENNLGGCAFSNRCEIAEKRCAKEIPGLVKTSKEVFVACLKSN